MPAWRPRRSSSLQRARRSDRRTSRSRTIPDDRSSLHGSRNTRRTGGRRRRRGDCEEIDARAATGNNAVVIGARSRTTSAAAAGGGTAGKQFCSSLAGSWVNGAKWAPRERRIASHPAATSANVSNVSPGAIEVITEEPRLVRA